MSLGASPVTLRSTYTRLGDLSMHARVAVEEGAQGRTPVVLIHGFVLASRVMVPAAQLLARDFPVYLPDLPGFGESDKPPTQSLEQLRDSIDRWMEAVGIERASFVGNSMGCQLIIHLALKYPHRVARMILQGPSVDPPARSVDGMASRLMTNMIKERSRDLNAIARVDYQKAGLPRVFKTAFWVFKDEPERWIQEVCVPVLIVRGGDDPVISQEWAERLAGLAPDGRLVVIPKGCHTLHFVMAEEFVDAIRPFLFEGERERAEAATA